MKNSPDTRPQEPDQRDEYELTALGRGERGKYLDRYRAGTNLALLDKEIREAFPTDEAVNEALRGILRSRSA
jgi:hypothetical protein